MTVPNLLAPEQLVAIQRAFVGSSLIIEHRFCAGGRAADSFVFDDYKDFEDYLHSKVRPGDALWFWRYNDLCRDENSVAHGKYPEADGQVLDGGSY